MALPRRLKGYPGHPSHPPLTDVSIGAYTVAAAVLVLGTLGLQEPAMAHGALLAISAGLILAPPTMLTGLLDWRDLPPRTPKRKLANLARSARKSAPWPDMSPFQLTGPQTPRRTGSADQWPMWLACRRRSPRRPRNHAGSPATPLNPQGAQRAPSKDAAGHFRRSPFGTGDTTPGAGRPSAASRNARTDLPDLKCPSSDQHQWERRAPRSPSGCPVTRLRAAPDGCASFGTWLI